MWTEWAVGAVFTLVVNNGSCNYRNFALCLIVRFYKSDQRFSNCVSTKGCQVFREAKLRNGRRLLLAVLNLCVPIRFRVPTLVTNHSVADSTQTINRCLNPEASLFFSPVNQHSSPKTLYVSSETFKLSVGLRLAVDFYMQCTWKMNKCRYLLYLTYCRQVGGSSVSSVAFFGLPWAKIDREAWS